MLEEVPNSSIVSDEDIEDVADKLGVTFDNSDYGTEEKESDSLEKTDTESTESNRSGESEKSSEDRKDDVDYKEKYSASTKEFQEKYKPMEESLKRLEQLSGKSLDDILKDYNKSSEEQIENKGQGKVEKDASKDDEVNEKVSSLEKEVSSLKEKVFEQDERNRLSAKEKVQVFQQKYGVSEENYSMKYQPFLVGIKEMRKENGDPYTLEEALELSYVLANKDNIDKIVDQKIKIRQHEQELSFSPEGAKQTSSAEKNEYSTQQLEAARRMHINLEAEEKSS